MLISANYPLRKRKPVERMTANSFGPACERYTSTTKRIKDTTEASDIESLNDEESLTAVDNSAAEIEAMANIPKQKINNIEFATIISKIELGDLEGFDALLKASCLDLNNLQGFKFGRKEAKQFTLVRYLISQRRFNFLPSAIKYGACATIDSLADLIAGTLDAVAIDEVLTSLSSQKIAIPQEFFNEVSKRKRVNGHDENYIPGLLQAFAKHNDIVQRAEFSETTVASANSVDTDELIDMPSIAELINRRRELEAAAIREDLTIVEINADLLHKLLKITEVIMVEYISLLMKRDVLQNKFDKLVAIQKKHFDSTDDTAVARYNEVMHSTTETRFLDVIDELAKINIVAIEQTEILSKSLYNKNQVAAINLFLTVDFSTKKSGNMLKDELDSLDAIIQQMENISVELKKVTFDTLDALVANNAIINAKSVALLECLQPITKIYQITVTYRDSLLDKYKIASFEDVAALNTKYPAFQELDEVLKSCETVMVKLQTHVNNLVFLFKKLGLFQHKVSLAFPATATLTSNQGMLHQYTSDTAASLTVGVSSSTASANIRKYR